MTAKIWKDMQDVHIDIYMHNICDEDGKAKNYSIFGLNWHMNC